MEFTYEAYINLLNLLINEGYAITDYQNKDILTNKIVVLRHDVDFSPSKALQFAYIEEEHRAKSTYFVLLRTSFYNIMEKNIKKSFQEIKLMGHRIGLHFDETQYDFLNSISDYVNKILFEKDLLSNILELPVDAVSMHRPSKRVLGMNLYIPGLENSYSEKYFKDFKYFSDSRMHWREDVLGAITKGEHQRVHILTHPFWYSKEKLSLKQMLSDFISKASLERFDQVKENFTDLESVMK